MLAKQKLVTLWACQERLLRWWGDYGERWCSKGVYRGESSSARAIETPTATIDTVQFHILMLNTLACVPYGFTYVFEAIVAQMDLPTLSFVRTVRGLLGKVTQTKPS